MTFAADPPPAPTPHPALDVAKAVAIAALSALATGLVTWALDEAKARVKKPPEPPGEAP